MRDEVLSANGWPGPWGSLSSTRMLNDAPVSPEGPDGWVVRAGDD